MKKEKQVKAYQRKTSSGKTVVVKAHTAKYDAAEEKAKKAALAKKGAGDEYSAIKDVNVKDFKDWYLFNDWDLPEEEWPETVRVADSTIKRNLGGDKKAYDKFCSKVDSNWSPGGYVKMHPAYTVNKNKVAPPPIVISSGDEIAAKKSAAKSSTKSTPKESPKADAKKAPRKSKRKGCKTC